VRRLIAGSNAQSPRPSWEITKEPINHGETYYDLQASLKGAREVLKARIDEVTRYRDQLQGVAGEIAKQVIEQAREQTKRQW
jgi:selenocysteine lyase/cysteine desulfurase